MKRGRPRKRQMIGFWEHPPLRLSGALFEDGMTLFEKMLDPLAQSVAKATAEHLPVGRTDDQTSDRTKADLLRFVRAHGLDVARRAIPAATAKSFKDTDDGFEYTHTDTRIEELKLARAIIRWQGKQGKSGASFKRELIAAILEEGFFKDVPQAHRLVRKRNLIEIADLNNLPRRRGGRWVAPHTKKQR
jgi:hypothetical protein